MKNQIIKQPNGKYCIYSSHINNLTHYDMMPNIIIDHCVKEYRDKLTREIRDIIEKLNEGIPPYGGETLTYEEMIIKIESSHGIEMSNVIKSLTI